jgi:hypothetical protein
MGTYEWGACIGRMGVHIGKGVCTCRGEGCGEELGTIWKGKTWVHMGKEARTGGEAYTGGRARVRGTHR